MYYPTVSSRVRVSGRDGYFLVVRVDHTALVVDLRGLTREIGIEENVPFHLLYVPSEHDDTSSPSFLHESRVSTINAVLDSTSANLRRSHSMLVELTDLIASTVATIRTSQRLIERSDHLITWTTELEKLED